jgi:TP901 family phage tail tape measure protein
MADHDFIIDTLLHVGLDVKGEDLVSLKKKLSELGVSVDLTNVKKQTEELAKTFKKLGDDRSLLQRAATKQPLSKEDKGNLPAAFNNLKTFQGQLNKVVNTLKNFGDSGGKPLSTDFTSLHQVMTELGAMARNVSPLIDNVTKSFKENSAAVRKSQTDAAKHQRTLISQERTAEILDRGRRTRAKQTPEGRKAFLSAARGNADAISTAASAKQGRAFAGTAVRATEKALQLERDRPIQDPLAIQRAERKLNLSAQTYHDLSLRADELTTSEAAAKKTTQEEKQAAAKVLRKQEAAAVKEANAAKTRAIKQQTLERNVRAEVAKSPEGQKAYFAAERGKTSTILTAKDASAGVAFASKELAARKEIHRLTQEIFAKDSEEVRKALQDVEATGQAYNRLTKRAEALAAVEALRKKDAAKADALALTEANIALSQVNRGRKDRSGRKALEHAGGIDAGVGGFKDIEAARNAERFVQAEYQDLIKLQHAYARAFGASSDQAKTAALETKRYADYLGGLQTHIETLTAAKGEQNSVDRLQEKIQTSEDKRRTQSIRNAKGKQLFERAGGDYGQLSTLGDVRKASKFAENELRQLELQQQATAKEAGRDSDAYRNVTAEVDKYAHAVSELNARHEQLAQTGKARVLRPSRSAVGSAVYPEGRKIYQAASKTPGGLSSLDEEDAKSARQYVQARLTEVRGKGKEFSNLYGVSSTQATAAGNAARKFAGDLGTLNEAIKPPTSGMNLLSSTLRSFLKYAVGYAALYGLSNALLALISNVAELQAQFLQIQAVTGSTDEQMGRLSQTVIDVAKNSRFSLKDLTEAALVLAQAGVSVGDMNTTLKATADFAAATGSNLQIAADLISTTRSVFKELSDDVIANQLAKAINISKLTGEDLKTILSLGAQTAKSFGLTSEQFLAAVSVLKNAGLKASTAATGLRSGMLEIFSPDLKLTKALQERYAAMGETMGSEAVKARFYAFSKGRAPLQAALTELKRLGFNDEGSQTLSRAFDVRSSNAIKAMISNLEELAADESKITFGRAAAEGADTTLQGLNASFTRLQSTIGGFVYTRSEGILGFFTEVLDAATNAIQALDEYDRRKRAEGKKGLPGAGELLMGGLPRQMWQFAYRNTVGRLFPPEQTQEEASAQADAQGQGLTKKQDEFEKYDQAAKNWSIQLAELGKNVGSTAESLLMASQTSEDLNAAIGNTFGRNLTESNEEIIAAVKSYAKLAPSERADRLEELKKQFPVLAQITKDMTKGEADRALFTIEQLADTVTGSLKGLSDQLNTKLVNSRKILDKLEGAAPSTPQQLEAQQFIEVVAHSEAIQEILNGTSKLAMDMQQGILQQAMQALSDRIQAKGATNPLDGKAKEVADQFIQRIKAISLSNDKSTAQADMRAAVTELLARFHDLDGAAISHLQEIQGAIFDAANQLGGGLMKKLLTLSVGKIQETIDSQATKVLQETADRVKYGDTIAKTFKNPKFKEYLKKSTDATSGGIQQLYSDIDAGGIPVEDARGNSKRYQLTAAKVKEYNDIQLRQDELVEKTTKETKKQLAMEDRLNNAQQKLDDAATNKQFGAQRKALDEVTAAKKAIAQQKYDDATAAMPIDVTRDPEKNKALIKEQVDAKHDLLKLDQEHAKQLEKINREESKVELGRGTRQKAGEQARLKGVLDSATNLTPQETIDSTIEQYDKVNAERLALFEKQLKQQGTLTDLSDAEIEEKRKSLAPYKEQAAYLELVFRRERQVRDDIDEVLSKALTSGNALNDARLEDKGLQPGNRTQRTDYLRLRQDKLTEKRDNALSTLSIAQQEVADLTVKSKADPYNKNVAESLARARAEVHDLTQVVAGANTELGQTELALERVTGTFESGFKRAFDPNVISRTLEQSENSFEHFGEVISDHVVTALEDVGDALADAALEGKSLSDGLSKIFTQLRKDYLRTIIKTLSNETIGSLTGSLFGSKEKGNQGWLPALAQRLGFGGKPAASTPAASATEPAQPGGFMDKVASTLFGGTSTDAAKTDACCLPKETADAMKKVAQSPDLASVVETEGKGFFASLGSGFTSVLDNVTSGFSKVFGNIGGLLGLASSSGSDQATGLFSLTTGLMSLFGGSAGGSATYKGAYGFAGGGIIHGPGTGTSDSIPAYVLGAGGRKGPLALSDGESILTAKATAALGPNFIHAVNSGRMLHARTGAIVNDQASLSSSTTATAASSQSGSQSGGPINYQVHVTPAQMRMRMGDWLEQQVLNERARR